MAIKNANLKKHKGDDQVQKNQDMPLHSLIV